MAKQIIRLTESDLHRLVKESVQKVLQEMKPDDFKNSFSPYFHLNKRSDKPISPKRNSVKKPVEEEIDEEGFDGAGNAGNSGQYLAGSGIVGDPEFWGDTKKRKNVTNMGETDPRK